ncbi:MAG TPA: GNAT family N-acetyltransferase [Baekduia sp.]|uniref:GNAT family N-acetyltransferase n=1 Tax=Baekduia sp. TaxID=2600305 RepID=UPI002D7A3BB3|nr:GNAT family N-acetyltransferase [Baekduia sp.]HET6505899.1 GNAT family N-acetyltransferase [Baekduia sp.]
MTGSAPEMAVVVRHADAGDAPVVARAVAALLTELGATPPDAAAMEDAARAVIGTGDAVLLAEEDGATVGVLAASWITTVHAGGMYALIQDLWVDGTRRGAGAGADLMAAFCALAEARGATRIEVGIPRDTFAGLADTRRFYERNGFELVGARMRRRTGR